MSAVIENAARVVSGNLPRPLNYFIKEQTPGDRGTQSYGARSSRPGCQREKHMKVKTKIKAGVTVNMSD